MKKLHNNTVRVHLNDDEIWTMLKMFRDGELIKLAPELEQRFILAYHEAKVKNMKAAKSDKYLELQPDIDEMLEVAETFQFSDIAIQAAWDAYVQAVAECDEIQHYEPLPYLRFAAVLNEFVKNYDMTPALQKIARETETLPFEIKLSDWVFEDFEKNLLEMQELQANLQTADIETNALKLGNQIDAVNMSIQAISTVRDAYNHAATVEEEPELNNVLEFEKSPLGTYSSIRQQIMNLHAEFEEDFEHLQESNEMELPVGDTIQEGKLQGVRAVLALLTEMENKFK